MNYCEECRKSFSTKYSLMRHQKIFHKENDDVQDDDDDGDSNRSSSDVSENEAMDTDDNSSQGAASDQSSSPLDSDNGDSFIIDDEDDDASKLELDEDERNTWQRIIKAVHDRGHFNNIKDVRDIWEDNSNLHAAKDAIQELIRKMQFYISSLNNGKIYPSIKDEIRELREKGYYKKESWNKAWDNRLYMIEMLLKENEDFLRKLMDAPKSTESEDDNDEVSVQDE